MSRKLITYPSWTEVAPDFRSEGNLRDIYILDTTIADWERLLLDLKARHPALRFTAGGAVGELPERVAQIFPLWERGTAPLLSFDVGAVVVTCHFFTPEEIEFSIDPADVTGPERLGAVAEFLHDVACAVGKVALLTPANLPSSPDSPREPEFRSRGVRSRTACGLTCLAAVRAEGIRLIARRPRTKFMIAEPAIRRSAAELKALGGAHSEESGDKMTLFAICISASTIPRRFYCFVEFRRDRTRRIHVA